MTFLKYSYLQYSQERGNKGGRMLLTGIRVIASPHKNSLSQPWIWPQKFSHAPSKELNSNKIKHQLTGICINVPLYTLGYA